MSHATIESFKADKDVSTSLRGTTFSFVTFGDLQGMRNDHAISQIRKHAMKEIGKSRRIPRTAKRHRSGSEKQRTKDETSESTTTLPSTPGLSWRRIGVSGVDPFCEFPVPLDARSRVLVMNIFNDGQKAYRSEWFSIALAHASTFHSLLACSALFLGGLRQPDRPFRENITALAFHQLALQSAQRQLSQSADDITDGLIGTALSLYQFTEYLDDPVQTRMQRNGLLALIRRRGIRKISSNSHLRNSISWVDLRSAYTRDTVPDIPIPESWLDATADLFGKEEPNPGAHPSLDDQQKAASFAEKVFSVYRRLRIATSEIRQHVDMSAASTIDVPVYVMIVIHELLSCQLSTVQMGKPLPTTLALEAWRIGMLLFLAPVYRFYGVHPIYMDKLVRKVYRLRYVWSMWDHWDPPSRTLLTWTVFTVAFEAEESGHEEVRRWCADVLARIAKEFIGPSDGQGLLMNARNVLWIPGLLDAKGKAFVAEIDEKLKVLGALPGGT